MLSTHSFTRAQPAVWPIKHRWLAAIGFAIVPVVFTAVGSAVGQVLGLGEVGAALSISLAAAISAFIGLLVMRKSGQSLSLFGFRAPKNARAAWWFVPPVVTVLVILMATGVSVTGVVMCAYLLLVVAVAVNEEVWFRGILLAVMRPTGIRTAMIVSSTLFAVLHLANLAGGAEVGYAVLQLMFAALFGLVAAELAVVTGSLWPAIIWHAAWDFVNFLGGDAISQPALVALGVSCTVMLVYAIRLWGRAKRIGQ